MDGFDLVRNIRADKDLKHIPVIMITSRTAEKHRNLALEIGVSGYILKSDSPSCGMERVRVYGESGMPSKTGVGIYAGALMDRFPLLPVEEEGRLHDLPLRENFVERVFCYRRWRDLVAGGLTRGKLVAFHTAHKLLLMAHSPKHYTEMGFRMVELGHDVAILASTWKKALGEISGK